MTFQFENVTYLVKIINGSLNSSMVHMFEVSDIPLHSI